MANFQSGETRLSVSPSSQGLNSESSNRSTFMEYLTNYSKTYRLCIVNTVVIAVFYFLITSENYIVDNVGFLGQSSLQIVYVVNSSVHDECEGVRPHVPNVHIDQYPVFRWNIGTIIALHKSDEIAFLIAYLVSGVCSDKFGGHLIHIIGLVFSGVIMLSLYFSLFRSQIIFICMYTLRKFNTGVALVASASLLGRTTKKSDRPWAASSVVAGVTVGSYLGECLPRYLGDWAVVSVVCGSISLLTGLSYWYLSQSCFPVIYSTKHIPWRRTFTSISLWIVVILNVAVRHTRYLRYSRMMRHYLYFMLHWSETPDNRLFYRFPFYFAQILACVIFATGTMFLVTKQAYSASSVRRAFLGSYLLLMLCGVVLITLGNCNLTPVLGGFLAVHFSYGILLAVKFHIILDVAPSFAGTFASLTYLLVSPYYYGYTEFLIKYYIKERAGIDFVRWRIYYVVIFTVSSVCVLPSLVLDVKKVITKVKVPRPSPAAEDNVEN